MAQVNLEAVRSRNIGKKNLLNDCIKIRQLLANGYGAALAKLEQDITTHILSNGKKKALTTALKAAETRCGIDPNAPIYLRFLTSEEFMSYGGQGKLFKDVGAGNVHGEFTHRIQWYVILHEMSAGFTRRVDTSPPSGWTHTPRDLLIEINMAGIQLKVSDWPEGPEGNQGFWDALFDRGPGFNPGYDPAVDGITNPEIFNTMLMDKTWLEANHGTLTGELNYNDTKYAGCYGALSATHPNLSRIVSERFVKREANDFAGKRLEYVEKKLKQTSPSTLYVEGKTEPDKKGLIGVLEMRIAKKDKCFLTTACVEARGLPDDCEELQVLRAFRDGYLSGLPGGPALIEEYYAVAPRIVEQIRRQPDAPAVLEGVYATVCRAVAQIRRSEHEAALRTYAAMVTELSRRYAR